MTAKDRAENYFKSHPQKISARKIKMRMIAIKKRKR